MKPEGKPENRIRFEPPGKVAACHAGESLMDAARRAGLEIASLCGGRGTCGRCRVRVVSGQVSAATPDEARALGAGHLAEGYRLACQARPLTDCRVHVPSESLPAPLRAQVESLECTVAPEPPVQAFHLDLESMFTVNAGTNAEALLRTVIDQQHIDCHAIDPEAARQLLNQTPRPRHASASVRGGELVAFGPWPGTQMGLAFDLGTTKIAGYLVDLDRGVTLAGSGTMNPQAAYGEDIITRLVIRCRIGVAPAPAAASCDTGLQ